MPFLCAHYGKGVFVDKGEKKKAQKFFQKIEKKNFHHQRIKRIISYMQVKFKK